MHVAGKVEEKIKRQLAYPGSSSSSSSSRRRRRRRRSVSSKWSFIQCFLPKTTVYTAVVSSEGRMLSGLCVCLSML